MQMTPRELIEHSRMASGLTTSAAQLMRALADQLYDYVEMYESADHLANTYAIDLADAERRADSWRGEAQALQRQLDMIRG